MLHNTNVGLTFHLRALGAGGQNYQVLSHLIQRGSLSPLEARNTYRVERLASRITELKQRGVSIRREMRRDESDHKYARYFLEAC